MKPTKEAYTDVSYDVHVCLKTMSAQLFVKIVEEMFT